MSIGDHVVGYATALVLGIAIGVTAMDIVRDLRAEESKAKPQRNQYAPVRSAKCPEFAAGQADGGKWKLLYCKRGPRA